MIVRITAADGVCVDDAMDFKRFKIVSSLERRDYVKAQEAGAGVIEFESADQAWVSAAGLEALVEPSQRETWRPEFHRMIEKARRHGWIRDDPLRIAAHVEWKAPD